MELLPNEKFIWRGQPKTGWRLKTGDKVRLPVMIAFTLFSVYWTLQATAYATPPNLWLMGVPFILFGVYASLLRYWIEAKERQHTRYAVTNRHVIIHRAWPMQRVTRIPLDDIDYVFIDEAADGSGDIVFGLPIKQMLPFLPQRPRPTRFSPCFEGIPQVKQVYGLIHGAQKK